MNLFRVHAYAVEPGRTTGGTGAPLGGAVTVTADVRQALEEASRQSGLEGRTLVDVRVDSSTRTSDVRERLLAFAFDNPSAARSAALDLASRLGDAMDRRSTPCLFIAAAARDGDRRQVTIWTFPRDEAFQFGGRAGAATIRLLTDVFSRTSRLRKAALFEGRKVRTDFLRGRVLDFQANNVSREVADFWIARFLGCGLAIASETGTRLLARTVRRVYEQTTEPVEREQLHAAISAIRHSPQPRWSMRDFADQYLQGPVRDRMLEAAPNPEALESSFDFDRNVFDESVNFRVFRLDSDVYVSAPFDEVGRSVTVQDQHLRCEGDIVDEKVRARHA